MRPGILRLRCDLRLDDLPADRIGTGRGVDIVRGELAWREFYADVLWHGSESARPSLAMPRPFLERTCSHQDLAMQRCVDDHARNHRLGDTGDKGTIERDLHVQEPEEDVL